MTLLQMSTSAAVLIAVITVLRAVSIHKLPKKTFMLLWGIVLFRLLIPISVPSVFSIYSWIPQNNTPYVSDSTNHFNIQGFSYVSDTVGENITMTLDEQLFFHSPVSVWTIVWITGFTICALYFVIAYHRGMKKFKNSLPTENAFIKSWREKYPLKRTLSIHCSDQVSTPLSYGIFNPVILLPDNLDFNNTKALDYILTHEYVHIRHFDILTKLLMLSALSIHWFNPMVWVMFLLLNRDIELVCDETVVKLFGEKSKSAYAHTLIDMEIQKSGIMPLCNNFSKNVIEERIGAIMKMKKTSVSMIIAAIVLILVIAGSFATSAKEDDGSKEAYAHEGYSGEAFSAENEEDLKKETEEAFSVYLSYGLIYDKESDCFYYQGKKVRYFKDDHKDGGKGFFYKNGEVDLKAVYDSQNKLTGIEEFSKEEFDARTESFNNTYKDTSGSFEEGYSDLEDDTLNAYKAFGVVYDQKTDVWKYQNKKIYALYDKDVLTFQEPRLKNDEGRIILQVIRNAKGEIQELREMEEKDFDKAFND